jgi:hypothetical protein
VASVEEAERRPAFGGYWQVAVIAMVNGERFVVEDGARRAARMVREAKEQAAVPQRVCSRCEDRPCRCG